jgi:hypothetical protein
MELYRTGRTLTVGRVIAGNFSGAIYYCQPHQGEPEGRGLSRLKRQPNSGAFDMAAYQADIERERQLVEEEQEIVESTGIRNHPEKRSMSIALILVVVAIAIGFFILVTYLPGLFNN